MKNKSILVVTFVALGLSVRAQVSEQTSPFKVTADLVSNYVWRGSMATRTPTPNIQPTLAFTKGNFEVGVWGSTDFIGSYKEIDPYISLTVGQFKFTVTDYNWNFDSTNYFNYNGNVTGHRLEGTIGFSGSETLPISFTWNTMFYGLDKKYNDSTKQAYSTYIELNYSKGVASFFLGFTPWASYYNNYGVTVFDTKTSRKKFSIVNIGLSITKTLKISETYSLPFKATLSINPSATYTRQDYVHLVFGITF